MNNIISRHGLSVALCRSMHEIKYFAEVSWPIRGGSPKLLLCYRRFHVRCSSCLSIRPFAFPLSHIVKNPVQKVRPLNSVPSSVPYLVGLWASSLRSLLSVSRLVLVGLLEPRAKLRRNRYIKTFCHINLCFLNVFYINIHILSYI